MAAAQRYDSNRILLAALIRRAGAEVRDLGILADRQDAIARALGEAAVDTDLIVTSGGVSAGEEDHVKAAVETVGQLSFWRLAIKPGRPVAMGTVRGVPFVGLPGNPVAAFVTFAYVARPLIAALGGAPVETCATLRGTEPASAIARRLAAASMFGCSSHQDRRANRRRTSTQSMEPVFLCRSRKPVALWN